MRIIRILRSAQKFRALLRRNERESSNSTKSERFPPERVGGGLIRLRIRGSRKRRTCVVRVEVRVLDRSPETPTNMTFDSLLAEFAATNDLPLPEPEADGARRLDFDDGALTLRFREGSRGVVLLEADLATLDPESDPGRATLSTALKGNLVRTAEFGGALAWDTGRRTLFLHTRLEAVETVGHRFTEAVESFLDQAAGFKQGLEATRR